MTDIMTKQQEYNKRYYADNKEAILSSLRKPIKCECGRSVQRATYNKHLESVKHKATLGGMTVFEYKLQNKN